MSRHADILVIGGGAIGLSVAYFLAKEGVRVGIADKGEVGQEASWAGAGMLPAGNPQRAKSAIAVLRAKGTALFAGFSRELREQTGIDNGYVQCGGLELRLSEDALERRRVEHLLREERGEGVPCEVLDGTALRQLEPALSPELPGALFYREAAQIRNPRHLQALRVACGKLGVKFFPGCPIMAMERQGERITSVRAPTEEFTAEHYLIAAGAWSDLLLAHTGWRAAIHPVRGQIVLLREDRPLFTHLLMAGPQYMVPRQEGRILIGSTEEEAGFVKANTVQGVADLLAFAARIVPALAEATVERTWAGLRPGSPDGKPFLGRVPGTENLYVAAGHFRSGLQLSAITGILMKELLLGQPLSLDLEPFRLDRRHDDDRHAAPHR
jgi:glycine oxidase